MTPDEFEETAKVARPEVTTLEERGREGTLKTFNRFAA